MDIDLDLDCFESDSIKEFLQNKLEEINKVNADLKKDVENLNDLLIACQEQHATECAQVLNIGTVWKKIHYSQFVIGINVENIDNGVLTDINPIIYSKKSTSPIYHTKIYKTNKSTNHLEFTNEIETTATIILIIEKPDFLKDNFLELEGIITYKLGELENQAILPKIVLSMEDFDVFETKILDLLNSKYNETFLAMIACSNATSFVLKMKHNSSRKLLNYLTIDCLLREVDFDGVTYYVFDSICDALNGVFLGFTVDEASMEIGLYNSVVFTRNEDQLLHVLHYLHAHIKEVTILPPNYKDQLLKESTIDELFSSQATQKPTINPDTPLIRDFGDKLRNQITAVANFQANVLLCTDKNELSDKYVKLRAVLSDFELQTDLIFQRLSVD